MSVAKPHSSSTRLLELDAARGIAMLLVCASHFFDIYVIGAMSGGNALTEAMMLVCRVATPAFVLISGVLLGYQEEAQGPLFASFRIHLLDRAVFLLTVGHVLISLSLATRSGLASALSQGQITDTLAFCMVVGVYLVPSMSKRLRLVSGLGLSLGSWLAWQLWSPTSPLPQLIESVMIGPPSGERKVFLFPLLPWFGLYIAGSAVGGWLKEASTEGRAIIMKHLKAASLAMIIGVLVIKGVFILHVGGIEIEPGWYGYISPYQKYPPGPLYLLLFAGAALLLVSVLFSERRSPWLRNTMTLVEPIGRNAFPIFIVQFFLYYTLFYLLVTRATVVTSLLASVLLPLSLGAIWICAKACQHFRVSRFLTMGLPMLNAYQANRSRADNQGFQHQTAA